jgi:hypothetical protein
MINLFITSHDIENAIITGVISSLLASLIFLLFLFCLKPKLKISSKIARYITPEGKKVFLIKVINCSFFKLIDVNVELFIQNPINTHGGKNLRLHKLVLKRDKIWYIEKRNTLFSKSEYATYAIIFNCLDDIDKEWQADGSTLHFKVICKHGLSGFQKVNTRHYYDKSTEIKDGKFIHGRSMEIIN